MPDINKAFRIWLPQVRDEIFKDIKLVDSSDTTWDLDADVTNFDITWPTIRGGGVASFTLTLNNPNRKYLDKFTKGNRIKFYYDYTDGTTLYKQFYIEGPKYGFQNGYKVFLHGRDYPQVADKRNFKYDFTAGVPANECFSRIVDDHFSTVITVTGVSSSMTENIVAKYEYVPGIQVMADILSRVNYDGRIENDNDITTFADTGVLSTTEAFIVGQGMLGVSGFGQDTDDEKNRVQVIGDIVEDCPMLRMKQSTTQQGITWIKDEIYKKSTVRNLVDVEDVATFREADLAIRNDSGTLTSIGMATIKPGQQIICSVPDCKIVGNYFIKEVKHSFTASEGWKTSLEINETKKAVSVFLNEEKTRREEERVLNNPNAMTDTLIFFDFNNENGISSLSDLTVADGKLKLNSGISEGTLISEQFTADDNWTEFEIRGKYNDDMALVEVHISNDGGYSYKEISLSEFNTRIALTSTGNKGRIKVVLKSNASNSKPELDSVCLLIKRG